MKQALVIVALIGLSCGQVIAQHESSGGRAEQVPVLPAADSAWPGAMIIIIVGMFLAALVIGPVVRAQMPEAPPMPHDHDDSHGHGHDHAAAGHH